MDQNKYCVYCGTLWGFYDSSCPTCAKDTYGSLQDILRILFAAYNATKGNQKESVS